MQIHIWPVRTPIPSHPTWNPSLATAQLIQLAELNDDMEEQLERLVAWRDFHVNLRAFRVFGGQKRWESHGDIF